MTADQAAAELGIPRDFIDAGCAACSSCARCRKRHARSPSVDSPA